MSLKSTLKEEAIKYGSLVAGGALLIGIGMEAVSPGSVTAIFVEEEVVIVEKKIIKKKVEKVFEDEAGTNNSFAERSPASEEPPEFEDPESTIEIGDADPGLSGGNGQPTLGKKSSGSGRRVTAGRGARRIGSIGGNNSSSGNLPTAGNGSTSTGTTGGVTGGGVSSGGAGAPIAQGLPPIDTGAGGAGGGGGGGGKILPKPDPFVPAPPPPIACNYDRAAGNYGSNFFVNLSSIGASKIEYCLQYGGGCCDPVATPTLWTGAAINVGGSGDGDYCLSVICTEQQRDSGVVERQFVVDSSLPNLLVTFPQAYIQSTQLPYPMITQSTDFGKPDHFYHAVNYNIPPPATCSGIYSDGIILGNASRTIASDFSTTPLTPAQQITNNLQLTDMLFGTNHLSVLFEDRERNLFSCQTFNVEMADFDFFGFSGTAVALPINGIRPFIGRVSHIGFFETVPNTSNNGTTKNVQGNIRLDSQELSITH